MYLRIAVQYLYALKMKHLDTSWDFRSANTKRTTHCFHSYPAMMIPQVAERLLTKYAKKSRILFDPYCGTGTSLVEANIKDIHAIGTDLNPLARLIAQTKTTRLDLQLLDIYLRDFSDFTSSQFRFDAEKRKYAVLLPQFKNIDFWFHRSTQTKLALIKSFIGEITDEGIKNFFLTAFSETVRESSLTKKGEFKLVRMPPEKREKFNPDSFDIIFSKLSRNRRGLLDFAAVKSNGATAEIKHFNTVSPIPDNCLVNESIDVVLTSPPYGDSRTTVAYGQYSRLSNQWMGVESQVDDKLMGGKKQVDIEIKGSKILSETIEKIADRDENRAREVLSFFADYQKSINHISTKLKKKKYACYVIGNRTVKGIQIPMDEITADFFKANGFNHAETTVRNIPNKRMPDRNSPTNVRGEKSATMKREYIVVMQKQ